jgi:hypothetical protein
MLVMAGAAGVLGGGGLTWVRASIRVFDRMRGGRFVAFTQRLLRRASNTANNLLKRFAAELGVHSSTASLAAASF